MTIRTQRGVVSLASGILTLLAAVRLGAVEWTGGVKTLVALTNSEVVLSGTAELRLTQTNDPLPGCTVELRSPDAVMIFTGIPPSRAGVVLGRVRVGEGAAVRDVNLRLTQYAQGTLFQVIDPAVSPLEVFESRLMSGRSRGFEEHRVYGAAQVGDWVRRFGSFRLKRGYLATLAQNEDGTGVSRCYVAQDGDLEVARLPAALEARVQFVRVFPWRWVAKKGVAGNIETGLEVDWLYNWNLDRNSALDWEYVPIRQNRWWPGLDQDWKMRGSTHLLGYNEPDHADQANLSVADALAGWNDLMAPGLRVGAPAVSDGGLGWLYDFIDRADAAGRRVDFVPVHYYRCHGNAADPEGAASQFYGFLKGIYDRVKRPLWVTEWNNGANWTACADPNATQQKAAIGAMIAMLDRTPFVERYAIYNWVEDARRVVWDNGTLTAAGVTYRDMAASLAYRQELPPSNGGAAAAYPLDGDSSDATGNANDAMRVGGVVFGPGRAGEAAVFDGVTGYLQLPPNVGDSTDFTFAAWLRWDGGGNWQRVFDLGFDTSRYLFLTPRSDAGTLRFAINTGSGEQQLNAPGLAAGAWTHIAVTLSGNTGRLYVNGVPVASNPSMTLNPSDVGSQFNYLGRSQFPADPLFRGRMEDVRFAGTAATATAVATMAKTLPVRFERNRIPLPEATPGTPYEASLVDDVRGTGPFTFTKLSGPAWLAVSPEGAVSGVPGVADAGLVRVRVRVVDAAGATAAASIEIPVQPISAAVESGDDDVEQAAGGTVSMGGAALNLGGSTQIGTPRVGLRFAKVPVPPGATVTAAWIQFRAAGSQAGPATLRISVEASDASRAFTTSSGPATRALTSLGVPWSPGAWVAGSAGAEQRTPNLAGLIQTVVSRPGWTAGGPITFVVTGTGNRSVESANRAGGTVPVLTVQFRRRPGTGGFKAWSLGHGGTGDPSADSDADGYADLMEYGLGLDPAHVDQSPFELSTDGGFLRCEFPWSIDAIEGEARVEWSDQPAGSWTDAGLNLEIAADDGKVRRLRASVPLGVAGARYLRVRVGLR